jgi:hypothetical protein
MSAPDLQARLSRLESTIKRDRILALLAIAFIFVGSRAIAQSPAKAAQGPITIHGAGFSATLNSRGVTVRDASGHERALCGVDSTGKPSVDLTDSHGTLRESLYLRNDTPVLRQFDRSGRRRTDLTLDDNDNGAFYILDENEKTRMEIYRRSNGDPQIALFGSDEKIRSYWATDDVSPYFVMRDADGKTRVDVGGFTDGTWGMDLRDANGTNVWKAP